MQRAKSAEAAQPFSIRLTKAEKDRLKTKAGDLPLAVFIRECVLQENAFVQNARRRSPIKDANSLGRLLGLLGQSRLASNLNQIAKAAHQGSLPVTTELEADLNQACAEIRDMRHLLLRALGVQVVADGTEPLPLGRAFAKATGGSNR